MFPFMCMHTCIHIYIYTYIFIRTLVQTHNYFNICVHWYMNISRRSPTHTHAHACTHTHITFISLTHTHTHACVPPLLLGRCIPLSFWEGACHQTSRGGWWCELSLKNSPQSAASANVFGQPTSWPRTDAPAVRRAHVKGRPRSRRQRGPKPSSSRHWAS